MSEPVRVVFWAAVDTPEHVRVVFWEILPRMEGVWGPGMIYVKAEPESPLQGGPSGLEESDSSGSGDT